MKLARRLEDEGDDDDDSSEKGIKVFTVAELMEKTVASEKTRKERVKQKLPRIWKPDGEYKLYRTAMALESDPDECLYLLQERALTLFKHVDPTVEFAADPLRPLWKGVFAMHPSMGYGPDQYYNPKQTHLTQIYAIDRPKKGRPADNMVPRRDGCTDRLFPYWVDDWQFVKNNDQKHKQQSRKKKAAAAASAAATESTNGTHPEAPLPSETLEKKVKAKSRPKSESKKMATSAAAAASAATKFDSLPCILPTDGVFIQPMNGWMKPYITDKRGPSLSIVVHTTALKASPAVVLAKLFPSLVDELSSAASLFSTTTADAIQVEPRKKAARPRDDNEEEDVVAPVAVPAVAKRPKHTIVSALAASVDTGAIVSEVLLQLVLNPAPGSSAAKFLAGGDKIPLQYYTPGNPGEELPQLAKLAVDLIRKKLNV